MKFNIRKLSPGLFNVDIEIENTKVDLGLMSEPERNNLALILRSAADEMCPDDVSYEELVLAYNESAGDEK